MSIKEVEIGDNCMACGLCGNICPEVFTLRDHGTVNEDVNYGAFESKIKEAALWCPNSTIKYNEQSSI